MLPLASPKTPPPLWTKACCCPAAYHPLLVYAARKARANDELKKLGGVVVSLVLASHHIGTRHSYVGCQVTTRDTIKGGVAEHRSMHREDACKSRGGKKLGFSSFRLLTFSSIDLFCSLRCTTWRRFGSRATHTMLNMYTAYLAQATDNSTIANGQS